MGIPSIIRSNVDAGDTVLAQGSILVGNASGVATALSAKTNTQILVGNGTTITSVAISGDATMDNAGALTVTDVTVGSDAAGDMQYKSSATALARLAKGTAGQVMVMNAGATAPSWATVGTDATLAATGALTIANSAVTSAKVEADLIRYADTQLTNDQMLAVRAAPITLVAAPGANRTIIVHKVLCVCSAAAGAYTETADNLVIEYGDGTDILEIETTGFIDGAAVAVRVQAPNFTVATPIANSVVRIVNSGDGEFGGGNAANTFSVRVWYSVADMVAFT